ncbi:pentapeptide repeat-containing protein [Candidatus Babeliales bacterium]|nr:pentapeptide repeat-containing protein [Candidatus Babeliales bacterium]MBP9843323.1 pentapeptide repeat-containing protein [Candidatus Babeliales bacterium]
MKNLIKIAILGIIVGFSSGMIFGYIPVQAQFLKNALQDSTKIANCANCDLRGVIDFAGIDARGLHAPGVTFQPCAITAANKDNGLMICIPNQVSNLTGINFSHANFFSSCFDSAILDKADLSGVDFSNSSIQNASLKDANVKGIVTTNAIFCNSVMPDGQICTETWTGQGVTIACNCITKGNPPLKASASSQKSKESKDIAK